MYKKNVQTRYYHTFKNILPWYIYIKHSTNKVNVQKKGYYFDISKKKVLPWYLTKIIVIQCTVLSMSKNIIDMVNKQTQTNKHGNITFINMVLSL